MSTESGIPDFRSPGGVWDRFDPNEFTFQNFIGSEAGRRRYWELGRMVYPVIKRAEPNPGHHALVTLWRLGLLDCVITQNIDNLHQRAGLPAEHVIELHGNATRARCLTCERPYDRAEIQDWLEANMPSDWDRSQLTLIPPEDRLDMLRAWQAKLHEGGWAGIAWPKEYGGRGASLIETAIFNQEMARVKAPPRST